MLCLHHTCNGMKGVQVLHHTCKGIKGVQILHHTCNYYEITDITTIFFTGKIPINNEWEK